MEPEDTSDETAARPAPAPRSTRSTEARARAPRKPTPTPEAPAVTAPVPNVAEPVAPTQTIQAVPVSPARPVDAVTPSRGQPAAGPYEPAPYRGGDPRHSAPTPARRPPANVYRARRPAFAALLIVPAVAVGLLLVRALAIAAFGKTFVLTGVIASCLGLAALPLLVSGLYGLLTGAAYGAEQVGFRVWARPPLAYLLVGIAFVIGAAIAA